MKNTETTKKLKSASLEQKSQIFARLYQPITKIEVKELESKGNRPLELGFSDQLMSLLYFHLYQLSSGRELLQKLEEDLFAASLINLEQGIKKSSFFDAMNHRGLEQLQTIFCGLSEQAVSGLPTEYSALGHLVAVDGSLIDVALSMVWADYRQTDKKAKIHLGFDINRGIPKKFAVTDGKADEKNYVSQVVDPGETAVLDRFFHSYQDFDRWQEEKLKFVCRIKANAHKNVIKHLEITQGSPVFFDAVVLLGSPNAVKTEKLVRVIGYRVGGSVFWVATNRFDLTAEQIALIYRLRWDIECFFNWWKNHLLTYSVIARSKYGFQVQVFAGLITFLLLSIYCAKFFSQKVSLFLLRKIQTEIYNQFLVSFARLTGESQPDKPPKVLISYVL